MIIIYNYIDSGGIQAPWKGDIEVDLKVTISDFYDKKEKKMKKRLDTKKKMCYNYSIC